MNKPDAKQCTSKPEASRQECECLSCAPAVAYATTSDSSPVKDAVAAGCAVDVVHEDAEGCEPTEQLLACGH